MFVLLSLQNICRHQNSHHLIPVLMILIPFSLRGATLSPGGVDSLVDTEHNEERYRVLSSPGIRSPRKANRRTLAQPEAVSIWRVPVHFVKDYEAKTRVKIAKQQFTQHVSQLKLLFLASSLHIMPESQNLRFGRNLQDPLPRLR